MEKSTEEAMFIDALEPTFADHLPFNKQYVKKLIDGGVTAINETVANTGADFNEIIRKTHEFCRICGDVGALVATTTSDIEVAKQEGKLAVILGLHHLPFATARSRDLGFVHMLHGLGLRIAQLTYQRRNLIADGCGERRDGGLSKFGIQVVEEMNKLGMLVDLSHVGSRSTIEAIEISKDPVVFSHSNCRSICDNVRNKSDEQIKALAEKEGVMGISAFSPLLKRERPPTMENFLDQINHVVELVGVNYVGLGLDCSNRVPAARPKVDTFQKKEADYHELFPSWYFATGTRTGSVNRHRIEEFKDPSKWKINIAKGLSGKGYSSSEIEKVLGRNFMRVFEKVWGK